MIGTFFEGATKDVTRSVTKNGTRGAGFQVSGHEWDRPPSCRHFLSLDMPRLGRAWMLEIVEADTFPLNSSMAMSSSASNKICVRSNLFFAG